jgi:hypothetical protein
MFFYYERSYIMSGTSNGFAKHTFVGCRVGTNDKIKMTYIPAHLNAQGKKVNARLVIPVLINEYGKNDPDSYRLIAWGKMGDMFARNLNKGKEMHFFCTSASYWADVFSRVNQTQMFDHNGAPLTSRQLSFTIRDFVWGADSVETLTTEMRDGIATGEGRRPAQWNIPGTQDNLLWKQMLQARQNTFFSQAHLNAGVFGFARVVMPKGGGQILFGAQYERNNGAPVGAPGGAFVPNAGMTPLPNMVHNAFNPHAGAPGAPGGYPGYPVNTPPVNVSTNVPPRGGYPNMPPAEHVPPMGANPNLPPMYHPNMPPMGFNPNMAGGMPFNPAMANVNGGGMVNVPAGLPF